MGSLLQKWLWCGAQRPQKTKGCSGSGVSGQRSLRRGGGVGGCPARSLHSQRGEEEEAGEGCPVDRAGALLAPGTSIPSASLPVVWRHGKSGAYTCSPPHVSLSLVPALPSVQDRDSGCQGTELCRSRWFRGVLCCPGSGCNEWFEAMLGRRQDEPPSPGPIWGLLLASSWPLAGSLLHCRLRS